MTTLQQRLVAKTDQTPGQGPAGDCWGWTGATDKYGCPHLKADGTLERASRVAYRLWSGDIPEGLMVRHTCDNPPCCNPAHLLLGTHVDNMNDREERGRTPPVVLATLGRVCLTLMSPRFGQPC